MEMAKELIAIEPEAITDNAVKLIGKDWMLVTAGTLESFNMMTASWGGIGVLWNWPVTYIVVRPGRHTRQFLDSCDTYTLTFFDEQHRDILNTCGVKSGRDIDKMHLEGLTPKATSEGSVYFGEARLVIECRKVYFQDIAPDNFLAPEIAKLYPQKDYHRLYVGRILSCLAVS
jgi:flavin reductase (DIM6/NTAB) family NADH-FMN oxidoreductase RutF